jgi:hypothetical protein
MLSDIDNGQSLFADMLPHRPTMGLFFAPSPTTMFLLNMPR